MHVWSSTITVTNISWNNLNTTQTCRVLHRKCKTKYKSSRKFDIFKYWWWFHYLPSRSLSGSFVLGSSRPWIACKRSFAFGRSRFWLGLESFASSHYILGSRPIREPLSIETPLSPNLRGGGRGLVIDVSAFI